MRGMDRVDAVFVCPVRSRVHPCAKAAEMTKRRFGIWHKR